MDQCIRLSVAAGNILFNAPDISIHAAHNMTSASGRGHWISPGVPARARPLLAVLLSCATSLCAANSVPIEPTKLPPGARATITQLQAAAEANDFAKLRSLMIDPFIWSFGGDASADQAIAAWRVDPGYLTGLRATLTRECHLSDPEEVECPGKGDGDFRAGRSPGQSQVVRGSSFAEIDVLPTSQQRNAQVRELIPVIEAASRELDARSAFGAGLQPLRPR